MAAGKKTSDGDEMFTLEGHKDNLGLYLLSDEQTLGLHTAGTNMQKLAFYLALFLSLEAGHVITEMVLKNQNNARACMHSCYPHDCSDVLTEQGLKSDGVYLIYPYGPYSAGVPVYCDMSSQGGPWTVFQKRFDGSVNFYRGWEEYKSGFGRADGEYWLGLKTIQLLTQKKTYRLRINLEDFKDEKRFVTYEDFSLSLLAINPEEDRYKLHIKGFQEGDELNPTGDSLSFHNGMKFSTYDHDEDEHPSVNCALSASGAFWYKDCHGANLNGKYLNGSTEEYATGLVWSSWKGHYYSLKRSEMKIAPSV